MVSEQALLSVESPQDLDSFDELPSVASNASCQFNGKQMKLSLGTLEYPGHAGYLFTVESCVLETGAIYGLVGPNGVGKSSFAKLLTSKTLPGFPSSISTCYLDSCSREGSNKEMQLDPRAMLETAIKDRCKDLGDQVQALEAALDNDVGAEEAEVLAVRLGELCEQEDDLLASGSQEIASVLEDLGFAAAGLLETPVAQLSSGWRYKARLAKALLAHADLLVLDEPSFLDVRSTDWLISRTKEVAAKGAIVCLISHKESLLEALANRILFISASKTLETYNCGYEVFRGVRSNEVTSATREEAKGRQSREHAEHALKTAKKRVAKGAKNYHKVVGAGEDRRWIKGKCKEAKQKAARSIGAKVKQLEKETERLEELAKAATEHRTQAISLSGSAWSPMQQMVSLQDVHFGYRPDEPVLRDVSLAIYGGDRIVLTGANGEGKSTLLKLVYGDVDPLEGNVSRASGQHIAYFPQDALEQLVVKHGGESATRLLQSQLKTTGEVSDMDARVALGAFGIKGDLALRPIRTLSAGQRTRLYLALLFSRKGAKPSLLVLDEVENLDAETTEALMTSLADFPGAVLCVTHDSTHSAFLRPRQVWHVQGGHVGVTLTEHLAQDPSV